VEGEGRGAVNLTFEWDSEKAEANRQKHGVSFEEAMSAFAHSLSFTIPDPGHSHGETRYLLLGVSFRRRLLVVSHTERGETIRIINARPASRREKRVYEEGED
jgi:uncharacterized DUF497 family protein